MKYALILIASVAVIFTACKKHSVPTSCYVCNQYDSVFTRNGGLQVFPNGTSDTQCEKNQGLINFYMETHVIHDSFYINTDSQAYGYTDFHCSFLQ